MIGSSAPYLNQINDKSRLFNRYLNQEASFTPNEIDSLIGYFLKRGFEETSAINTSAILLEQAYIDKLNVQQLIDTLRGVNNVQLSNIVATILNFNRPKSSRIGYLTAKNPDLFDERNIVE